MLLGEQACRGSGPLKARSITREKGASREQDAGLGGCGKHWGTQNSCSHRCHGEQAEHSKVQDAIEMREREKDEMA